VAAELTKSKVKKLREQVKTKANEEEGWIPHYLSGGSYGNGRCAPLN